MKKNILTVSILVLCLVIYFIYFSSKKSFVIKSEKFAASDVCDGKGIVGLKEENSEFLKATLQEGREIFFFKTGLHSIWCGGLTHKWIGKANYAGYIFKSNPDNPLQFVVDRKKHYYYMKGNGTITMPDGKMVKLGY